MSALSVIAGARASASRIAKWMLEKGRPDDAVQILTVWAVNGANDAEGHALLAEALRIDPSAAVAKAAFERMEGMTGDHSALDDAIKKYTREELQKIEAEIRKPSFRKAQVGFNNNIKFRDMVFHVQTEDSGLDKPHIITHLFADGGRVIKSHKRSYASEVSRPDVSQFVRQLMKAQHMEMVVMLREGKFDDILAGKRIGGMEMLAHPPVAAVAKMNKGKDAGEEALPDAASQIANAKMKVQDAGAPAAAPKNDVAAAAAPAPAAKAPAVVTPDASTEVQVPVSARAAQAPIRFKLHVVRALWHAPETFAPRGNEVILGRRAISDVSLDGERFCHPDEALIRWRDGKVYVEDIDGGAGVFLRIRQPMEVDLGDEFIVGDQLVRICENPIPDVTPGEGPTYFYSSPTWLSSFRLVQIYEGDREGACIVAQGTTVIVGRSVADLVFANDPLVDEQHCIVEEQAGTIVITDLNSRTGVFVRAKGEHELVHGDEILVGRTRLMVDLNV